MTIQQYASFDVEAKELNATSKKNPALAKMVAAWENKNAKRAMQGTGLTLMAISLTACGGSSTVAVVADDDAAVVAGTTAVELALTVGSDGTAAAPFGGATAGDDTVSGARIDDVQTLNNGDVIDLGAGEDTLTANLNAGTTAPTVTNTETVQVTALGIATLDFVNITGVTTGIIAASSSAALTLDNIAAITPITISNTSQATTIIFNDGLLTGETIATLNLSSVSAGIITMGGETDGDGGIETINIVASGANVTGNIAFGTTATTVNVSGSGSLDINAGAEFALVTSFDGSTATGDIDVSFADRAATTTGDISVTTGSGNDDVSLALVVEGDIDNITVDLNAGNDRLILDANTDTGNAIVGGDGNDTLQLDIAMTAVTAAYVSEFEILEMNGGADVTQDMDLVDGMNIVNIFDMTAGTNDLNIDDAADGLVINANGALLAATATATNADMTILSVDLKSDTATDDMTLNLSAAAGGVTIADFLPNSQYETVTVNSSGTAGNEILDISSAKTNMVFTGATALTVTTTGALLGVADASAMTAVFTTTSSTTALTVTGGSAADVMTSGLLATGVTQTFNGGDGGDTMTAGQIVTTGNLVLNGQGGSDTLDIATMDGNTTGTVVSTAVLDGGAGVDFITLDAVNILVLANVGSTALITADGDKVVDFDTTEDDFLYTGALLNDTNTGAVIILSTTLDLALAGDTDATIFLDSGNLVGASATLTTLANTATSDAFIAAADAFIAQLVIEEGTITNLDTIVGAGESVLLGFENGTDSVTVRFTNSDTTVANTMTAAELEVIAVFDAAVLVAADYA